MPTPSKVEGLPEPLKAWLESELERRKYTGYETLAGDLNQKLAELGRGREMLSSESVRRFASRRRFALEMDAAVREEMQKLASETGGIDAAAWDAFYVNRMRMLIARGILEAGQREQVNIRDLERLHRMAMQLEKRGSSPGRTPHPQTPHPPAPSPGTGEREAAQAPLTAEERELEELPGPRTAGGDWVSDGTEVDLSRDLGSRPSPDRIRSLYFVPRALRRDLAKRLNKLYATGIDLDPRRNPEIAKGLLMVEALLEAERKRLGVERKVSYPPAAAPHPLSSSWRGPRPEGERGEAASPPLSPSPGTGEGEPARPSAAETPPPRESPAVQRLRARMRQRGRR